MAGRGGARLGAGRKRKDIPQLGHEFWAGVMSTERLKKNLVRLCDSQDEQVALKANLAVAEHIYGKAKETVDMNAKVDLTRIVVDL